MRPHGNQAYLEKRRFRAIELLKEGLLPVEISKRMGVDRRSVRRWKAAYLKKGESAIKALQVPGRPTKLTDKDKSRLERMLLKGAQHAGYSTDLWTGKRVARVIKKLFRITYHPSHVCRLLHSIGWTPQKPERRARERNEKAIANWIKTDWERIKKKPVH
jgi:transposase